MTKTLKSMLIEDIAKEKDPKILEWLKKEQRIMDYRESVIQELKGKKFGQGWGLIADFIIQRKKAMLDEIEKPLKECKNNIENVTGFDLGDVDAYIDEAISIINRIRGEK